METRARAPNGPGGPGKLGADPRGGSAPGATGHTWSERVLGVLEAQGVKAD